MEFDECKEKSRSGALCFFKAFWRNLLLKKKTLAFNIVNSQLTRDYKKEAQSSVVFIQVSGSLQSKYPRKSALETLVLSVLNKIKKYCKGS